MKQPTNWFVIWLTWLSWSWKSTIAEWLNQRFCDNGYCRIQHLDGDVVRESLTKDLGFSKEDRHTNIQRVTFLADMLSQHQVGVIASFISPYKEMRDHVKDNVSHYIEVFVNTPLEVCEERDVKWLYKKARAGEIKGFTWIDAPYEHPEDPHIEIRTHEEPIKESVQKIIDYLIVNKYI